MAYNKVIILGRLTADPELRRTNGGIPVASYTVAVDRQGKDKQADFVDVVSWRESAEFVARNFHKGKEILVEGKLQTRMFEGQDGKKRKAVEVVSDEIRFVGKKEDVDRGGYRPQPDPQEHPEQFAELQDDDEELPF